MNMNLGNGLALNGNEMSSEYVWRSGKWAAFVLENRNENINSTTFNFAQPINKLTAANDLPKSVTYANWYNSRYPTQLFSHRPHISAKKCFAHIALRSCGA